MLCLYCDTELKPFRGLFDEDFCSREHREKYLSSFRKALTGFGGQLEPVEKTSEPPLSVPAAPAPDPRTAGFQPIQVFPLNHEAGRDGHPPELLTVSQEVEIPNSEIAWSAVLEFEERPADLAMTIDSNKGWRGKTPRLITSMTLFVARLSPNKIARSFFQEYQIGVKDLRVFEERDKSQSAELTRDKHKQFFCSARLHFNI